MQSKSNAASLRATQKTLKGRGLDPNDPRAVSLIRKRVGACLFSLKAEGIARDVPTAGPYEAWELVA